MNEIEGQTEIPLGVQPRVRGRVRPDVPPQRTTWQRVKMVSPPGCDVCREAQITDPTAPWAPRARFRLLWGDGHDEYLCATHADDRRAQLRLPRLEP